MGFLTNILSSVVKVALTPVAIVKDAIDIVKDKEVDNTKKLLESAAEDIKEAGDTLMGENDDGLF